MITAASVAFGMKAVQGIKNSKQITTRNPVRLAKNILQTLFKGKFMNLLLSGCCAQKWKKYFKYFLKGQGG